MIDLFLSEPTRNDVAEDDSTKLRIRLLKELETVIWSAMISAGRAEPRMWLCKTIAGLKFVTPRDQRVLFVNLLRRTRGQMKQKQGLSSQLLHLMFDKSPQKPGSVLSRKSRVLENFFIGNPKRVSRWFSYSGVEQGKGLRALSQFAFKNRDICWEELEWNGKHGQSPAMVATKPHYFLDLDIHRTVENFLENVPEFWSSNEVAESVKDGDIFLIDRSFFVSYFEDLMYKEDSRDVWEVIDEFLEEQTFSCLCEHLLIALEEQDLCYFLELLCKCLDQRIEFQCFDDDVCRLFVAVLLKCGVSGSIDWMLLFNAVVTQGRQLLRLLRYEEAEEPLAKVDEIVSKISAIPSDGNSLTPILKNRCKMGTVEMVKCLGLQSWVLYYRLSQECRTPESWESVFVYNQIGFRDSSKHALIDEDGPSQEDCSGFDCSPSVRVKKRKKQKARKKRRRTYDHDDGNDDELLGFDSSSQKLDFLSNAKSWLLSTDEYSSAWSSADLPEHLHRQCLSRWMIWLFEK